MAIFGHFSNFGGQKGVGRGQQIFVFKFFLNYIYQKATEKTIAIIIFSNFKIMIRPTVQPGFHSMVSVVW